jgi:hypothetical protein
VTVRPIPFNCAGWRRWGAPYIKVGLLGKTWERRRRRHAFDVSN